MSWTSCRRYPLAPRPRKERHAAAQLAHLNAQLDAMDLPPIGKGERPPKLISDHKSEDEMTEAEWNEDSRPCSSSAAAS